MHACACNDVNVGVGGEVISTDTVDKDEEIFAGSDTTETAAVSTEVFSAESWTTGEGGDDVGVESAADVEIVVQPGSLVARNYLSWQK